MDKAEKVVRSTVAGFFCGLLLVGFATMLLLADFAFRIIANEVLSIGIPEYWTAAFILICTLWGLIEAVIFE